MWSSLATKWPRSLATPLSIAILCLLTLAFFWRVIVLGQILLRTDPLYAQDPLWQAITPYASKGPVRPLNYDGLVQFYPWTELATHALHQGIVPLWNPYTFAGTPFLAAMQPAVLYPLNLLLEWLLAPVDVLGARALVHLALTLAGTFLFARSLALSRPASVLAALAFGLSQAYVVWLGLSVNLAFTWLPWLLLCVEYTITTRGRPRWLVTTAVVVALEMLAGHGESAAHILMLCGAYALFRAILYGWQEGRPTRGLQPLLVLFVALLLGGAMAAAQLLPTLAQLPHGVDAVERAHTATVVPIIGAPRQWITLILGVVPYFFGSPLWKEVGATPTKYFNYNEIALYIGAIPLLLAILAVSHRRRDPYVMFFAVAAVVALGMAVSLPILGLLDNLPLLRVTDNGRLRIVAAFAVAMLAAFGLDALPRDKRARPVWRLTCLWTLAVSALAISAVLLLHIYPSILSLLSGNALTMSNLRHIYPGISGLARTFGHLQPPPFSTTLSAGMPAIWLMLFLGLLWLHQNARISTSTLRWGSVVIAAVDLFALGVGYNVTAPRAQALATPPAIRAVQHDHSLYRISALGNMLAPSLSILYSLQDIRGYDSTYDADYARYFTASFPVKLDTLVALRVPAVIEPDSSAARALDLSNVKYVFAICGTRLETHVYIPVFHQGASCVYRNASVLPRALLVHRVQWATADHATTLLGQGHVDPRTTALLDPTTVDRSTWPAPVSTGTVRDSTQVTQYSLNEVDIVAHSVARGVLVLGDAYAPGWKAYVDGQPTRIARANAIFRAVSIGPGTHRVRFSYEPSSFTIGAAISIAALVLWGGLLLFVTLQSVVKRRRLSSQLA